MNPIMHPIQMIMLPLLQWSYDHVYANYAISIVLLTVAVKAIFFPLSQKQFQSMKKMSEIQPEMKKLQEKFKNDPKQLQPAMMALYKENKVNPLGGCLPLLVQMPVLIALFKSLDDPQFKTMLAQPGAESTLFWLHNLSTPDPFYVIPVLIGISTWLTQKLSSSAAAPMEGPQKFLMSYMPVLMVLISSRLPSGVGIYWLVSQVLGAAQQYFATRPAGGAAELSKQGT